MPANKFDERLHESVRFAAGSLLADLGLTPGERAAFLGLIAGHQQTIREHAGASRHSSGETRGFLRARKRKLDTAIRELVGEHRFALFARSREGLLDEGCF